MSNTGLRVFASFDEVVVLTTCHRLVTIEEPVTDEEREFNARAERFVQVLRRLRDLEWTAEDYFWLCKRSAGQLTLPERRRFADAPVHMDFRKATEDNPEQNCDHYNRGFLRNMARKSGLPVVRFAARHEGISDVDGAKIADEEFNGLVAELELAEGARVLLTHNLAVEHGLMNGTQGLVRQIVYPPDCGPTSEVPARRSRGRGVRFSWIHRPCIL
jgi:hypothetical protein